jgi:hypothetical protein
MMIREKPGFYSFFQVSHLSLWEENMKHKITWLILLSVLALVACGAQAVRQDMAPEAPAMGSAADMYESERVVEEAAVETSGAGTELPERMIIRNGELELIVRDTQAVQEEIATMIDELEGYVISAESYAYDEGRMRVNMTLRVPAETFSTAMARLRDLAVEIQRDGTSSQDVTEEYVDLMARLRAQQSKAQRLEELMEQAEDTEAVLEIFRELSATQEEIERIKGRMQYLENSTAMATITVYLMPDETVGPVEVQRWRPGGALKSALEALIETLKFLVEALIWLALYVVPVLLIIGLIIFGIIKLLRLIFPRKPKKTEEPAESADAPEDT